MRWPGQTSHVDEEEQKSIRAPYVDTVIEVGHPGSRDTIDASAITVEQDMFTNTKSRPLF